MRHPVEGETPEELGKEAAKLRCRLTPFKLHRWQQAGLLPKPRQIHLGYGRGTTTLYPVGTKSHLLALVNFLKQYRRIPVALWLLWWNGFPVPEDKIRELLRMELRVLFQARKASRITNLKSEARFERAEKRVAKRRLPHPLLATMRRRSGKNDFPFLLALIREIGSGAFEAWHQEEEPIVLAKGMSWKSDRAELKNIPLRASQLFSPLELERALQTSETENLQAARRQLKVLLKLLENCAVALDELLGMRILVPLFDQPLRWPFGMWLQIVLVWLSLSASTEFNKGYEFVISVLAAGGELKELL